MAIHTVSICSGIGGIERGLHLAAPGAFVPVLYVEREITAAGVLAASFERGELSAAPVWSDVNTITRGSCARYLDKVGVDAIVGGYPCQPFSLAGRNRGENDPRHLWPAIVAAIERFHPRLCFFENFAAHVVRGFDNVHRELEQLGYSIAAGLFTAQETGAPHRRERLFFLAISNADRDRFAGFTQRDESFAESEPRNDVDRRCENLADTDPDGLQRLNETWTTSRAIVGNRRNSLADSHTATRRNRTGPNRKNRHRSRPAIGGRVMVDADRIRRAERRAKYALQIRQAGVARSSVFPPGPNCEQWESIPDDLQPATESAFCGLADGFSRTTELHAMGNAVSPQCCAVAFVALLAALTD